MNIPALKRPTLKHLKAKFPWIVSAHDTSPTKKVSLDIISILKEGENYISGKEYEKRLPSNLLGYQQAVWLVEHQDEFPDFMALLGKVYIDFTGLVVVNSRGRRFYPYLDRFGGRWYFYWHWIDRGFSSSGRIASSGKLQSDTLKP